MLSLTDRLFCPADPLEVSAGKEDATGEKDGTCKEVETSVDQSPNNMSDDQPLSTWFDGRHSPKPMDGTGKFVLILRLFISYFFLMHLFVLQASPMPAMWSNVRRQMGVRKM